MNEWRSLAPFSCSSTSCRGDTAWTHCTPAQEVRWACAGAGRRVQGQVGVCRGRWACVCKGRWACARPGVCVCRGGGPPCARWEECCPRRRTQWWGRGQCPVESPPGGGQRGHEYLHALPEGATPTPPLPSHLEVGGEGVRQTHVAWEGTEYQVAHLNAVGRDDVAEGEVVLAEELGEVVQQDQEHPQRALEGGGTAHTRTQTHPHKRIHAHTLYKSCVALLRSAFLRKGERKVNRSMRSIWNRGHP